jgi:hypothetical protein
MDKSYPSKPPMVVHSLYIDKDLYRPRDDGEELLGPRRFHISMSLERSCTLQIV